MCRNPTSRKLGAAFATLAEDTLEYLCGDLRSTAPPLVALDQQHGHRNLRMVGRRDADEPLVAALGIRTRHFDFAATRESAPEGGTFVVLPRVAR